MKKPIKLATATGAALFAMLGAMGAGAAATCQDGCTGKHNVCTKNGGDYAVCMNAWRQCKTACMTPVKTSPAPAQRPTPVVARR